MISVVGTGISLPFDVEPYKPGDSEYAAGMRLLKRAVSYLGPRFAGYGVVDAKFATAPFLHTSDAVGLPIIARLKQNLPELAAAVEARFGKMPPAITFPHGEDKLEAWMPMTSLLGQPWIGLPFECCDTASINKDGTVIQADWLTNFPVAKLPAVSFFKRAKSRWEVENECALNSCAQGFNDANNLYRMEHIQHHHPNSMVVNWLFLLVAIMIERLYRIRYLHRGTHPILTAMQLKDALWLNLRPARSDSG